MDTQRLGRGLQRQGLATSTISRRRMLHATRSHAGLMQHVVQEGESLTDIAHQYGISSDAVKSVNERVFAPPKKSKLVGLLDPDTVYPGQRLVLPEAAQRRRHTFVQVPTREELLALPQTHPLQTAAVTTAFAVAASARLFPAAWQQAGTAVKALPANLQSSAATAGAAVKALMAPAAPAAALPAAASTGTDSKPLSKVPAAAAKATPAVAGFAPASAQVSLTPAAAAPASAQSRVSAPVIVPAESRPLRAVPSGGGSGAPSSSGNGAAGGASASGASNGASSSSASGQTRYSSVSSVFTPTPASGNGGSGGASQGSNGSAPLAHSLVALKGRLLDAVYNTARGLDASTEQRGVIEELVSQLENANPTPAATSALPLLAGRWKLVYTSNTPMLLLLNGLRSAPLIDVGDVYQEVAEGGATAINKIDIAMPRVMSLTASTSFEVRTPRQFKVRLTKVGLDTYIQTPALASHLDIPDSLTVLGQTLDLSPLRALVAAPVNAGIDTARALVGAAVAPAIGMGAAEAASLWMLTTYLDDSLRVSRDDAGKVFVLIKEVA